MHWICMACQNIYCARTFQAMKGSAFSFTKTVSNFIFFLCRHLVDVSASHSCRFVILDCSDLTFFSSIDLDVSCSTMSRTHQWRQLMTHYCADFMLMGELIPQSCLSFKAFNALSSIGFNSADNSSYSVVILEWADNWQHDILAEVLVSPIDPQLQVMILLSSACAGYWGLWHACRMQHGSLASL